MEKFSELKDRSGISYKGGSKQHTKSGDD